MSMWVAHVVQVLSGFSGSSADDMLEMNVVECC